MLLILQSAPCRLAPNEALPHTPLGALPCTHKGFHPLTLTRDVSLDLLLASLGALFYFMLAIYFGLLCPFLISHSSFLIPHSSLLTPHLNSAPIKNFPLIIPPKSAILLISKIARNHNPKEVNFYELYSFQKLLSVL